MPRRYLEDFARSIDFSNAIRLEQTQQDAVPQGTATSYDNASDAVSEVIHWEIGQTFNTGATREVVSNDKCERFALLLSEDEMAVDKEPTFFLPAATSVVEEQESMAKSRSKQSYFAPYSAPLVDW